MIRKSPFLRRCVKETASTNSAGVEAVIALIVIVLILGIAVFILGYKLRKTNAEKRQLDDKLRAEAEAGQMQSEVDDSKVQHLNHETANHEPTAPKWPEDEDPETLPLKSSD